MRSRLLGFGSVVGLALAVFHGGGSRLAASVDTAERAKQVDALFAKWDKPDAPGAAVAVMHRGKIIHERGFGAANLEYGIPIKPETVFHVASVSKQFTAMAIVLLEQEGKLSLDDEVHKHLPELPDYGRPITLRHLLQHTSGIRDQWSTLGLAGWDLKDIITQEQILRVLFRQKELNFSPGERTLYSNGGFTLLAEIVRRVSGQALPTFCQERIFKPLGMTRTHFHLQLEQIVPDRAYSYEPKGRGYVLAPLNYANVGATSLFSTAGDLVRWLDNFREPKVGTAKEIARMQEQGVLTSGKESEFALGLIIGRYRGLRTVGHSGGDAGYRAHVLWFPEQEFGVAIASNHARFNPALLANEVADVFLGEEFTVPKSAPAPPVQREAIAVAAAALDRFAGSYAFDAAPEFVLTYTREGERFYAQATGQDRFEIFPESPTKFFYKVVDAQVSFVADADGGVNGIIHYQGGREQKGTRVTAPQPAAAGDFASVAGHYWSEELETRYTFFLRDNNLYASHLRHGEMALTPASRDRFRTRWWFMPNVEFLRDPQGNVTGAKLGGGRVVGIRFTRQPASDLRPSQPTQ